ncbi:lipopolysaccharide biosynthesis protein [Pelomonas sp. SE-A7]|uniref:lipopolysaccharide biosynthesis protein n=1 Tax=Pelomonas sp. SE-A7 TaxID=3054953 RepID=UPI00259D01A5|nr:lipopolysaccharide biosynthesis protein [Pelomonas sp. SE-A7]MDM4764894.1 lipopolysaccharide biosynthesis protein [Pelomonas sp. SE-A7]
MTVERQFLQGLRWTAASRLGSQIISWVGTIYVMRTLSPQDYGLSAICTAVLSIVAMAAEFGIGAGIVQAERLDKAQMRSIFGASILFSLSGAALVALLAPALAAFYQAPEAAPLIQIAALQLVMAPLSAMSDAQLRRDLRFRGSSVIEVVVALAATLTTAGMAWKGYGVWSLIIGPLAGTLARVVLLNLLVPLNLWPSFKLGAAKGLIGFGFKVALSRVASYVFGQSDVLIAGRMLSKNALGEYSVAMHLAMLPVSRVMSVVNQVTYPVIAQLHREAAPLRPALLMGLRLVAYVVVPVLWGLAALSPWLIPALLGPNWGGAVAPLQIVSVALPLRLLSVLQSSAIQGTGHAGIDLRNSITGVILMPCCFLIGGYFGAQGLALAWLIGLPLLVGQNIQRSSAVLGIGIGDALGALAKPAAFSAAMAAAVVATGTGCDAIGLPAWPSIVLMMGVASLVYLGLLFGLDRDSARQLLKLVRPSSAPDSPAA